MYNGDYGDDLVHGDDNYDYDDVINLYNKFFWKNKLLLINSFNLFILFKYIKFFT